MVAFPTTNCPMPRNLPEVRLVSTVVGRGIDPLDRRVVEGGQFRVRGKSERLIEPAGRRGLAFEVPGLGDVVALERDDRREVRWWIAGDHGEAGDLVLAPRREEATGVSTG